MFRFLGKITVIFIFILGIFATRNYAYECYKALYETFCIHYRIFITKT